MSAQPAKRCTARTKLRCLWGSHRCGLKRGHAGRHRCTMQKEGTLVKRYRRSVPCNITWGVR